MRRPERNRVHARGAGHFNGALDDGSAVVPVEEEIFPLEDRLREAARNLQPTVAVSVLPSFAARWLVPRLGSFFAEHPGIDVRISPSERLVDLAQEPIDLGIRFGTGHYPGLVVRKLADDVLVLVCAPLLLRRKKLDSLVDLRRHTLLHDDEPEAWSRFLQLHEAHGVDVTRGSANGPGS